MPAKAFHVMVKPHGPVCNLGCAYCFYLEKEETLYPGVKDFRMPAEVMERFIGQYIAAQDAQQVNFAWQGGEPTLLGLDFFRSVVELQKRHCPSGKQVTNAFQTNGTLLDGDWCKFLKENGFLVGLSIDGPKELHDAYRRDKGGAGSFERVLRGMETLRRHRVEFNTLTVVSRGNCRHPLEVYRFLKEQGSGFMQFIPLVERESGEKGLAEPASLAGGGPERRVTEWSVPALDYGDFLNAIFDEWVRRDVGRYFVQSFDVHLAAWLGMPPSLCVYSETCGNAMALEHNGDLYSCDHYVYRTNHLGNIMDEKLERLADSEKQRDFGRDKRDRLPRECRECDVRFACNGECPKNRFLRTESGESGLNYLCAGLKRHLKHIDPFMRAMADLVRSGRPASSVMTAAVKRQAA